MARDDNRSWRDWFEWQDLAAAIGGGTAGFLAGGPVGAIVGAGGAYAAGNIAQLGAPEPIDIGRRPLSADLNEQLNKATAAELSANRAIINQQLAGALRRTDLQYGQHGIFRSGGRLAARGDLESAAMRDLATATAGTQLERLGIQEQARQFDVAQGLQQAQFDVQRKTAENQMWFEMAKAGIPLALRYGGKLFGSGETVAPTPTLEQEFTNWMGGGEARAEMFDMPADAWAPLAQPALPSTGGLLPEEELDWVW